MTESNQNAHVMLGGRADFFRASAYPLTQGNEGPAPSPQILLALCISPYGFIQSHLILRDDQSREWNLLHGSPPP